MSRLLLILLGLVAFVGCGKKDSPPKVQPQPNQEAQSNQSDDVLPKPREVGLLPGHGYVLPWSVFAQRGQDRMAIPVDIEEFDVRVGRDLKGDLTVEDIGVADIGLDTIPLVTDVEVPRIDPRDLDVPGVIGLDPNEPKNEFPKPEGIENGGGSGIISGQGYFRDGFSGRSGATKTQMLRNLGGTAETERAVALGLIWLAKQQKVDGSWEFDGNSKEERVAATGMALLPFLSAGETHKKVTKYSKHVGAGLAFLVKQQKSDGSFQNTKNAYGQAIATLALCELFGLTGDPALKASAQAAVNYLVKSQAEDGSWGYVAKTEGDTSITGWHIQALKSAKLAGLTVPDAAFKNAGKFLDKVQSNEGANYGYKSTTGSKSMTAVGLLCRQYSGWGRNHPGATKGVAWLWEKGKPTADDLYYTYYATQVFHFYDGAEWREKWNPAMQKALLPTQITDKTEGAKAANIGSWNPDKEQIGTCSGRLGTTCLAVLSLEVYYRHTPLFKREASGDPAKILEGLK